jgi:DNA-binding SARP family transcriptional activator/tetratricopeptide (TPR) repeat protein
VPADRLVDLLWDGEPPATARNALRSHISRLRAVLDQAEVRISKEGPGYTLRTNPETIDAHRFRSLAQEARELTDPARRATVLRQALELWRGPVLADIATSVIRDRLGAGLDEQRLEVLDQRIVADLALGRHHELIVELRELVAVHTNRERFTSHLMVALYRSGRQADALALYEESRRILADELGLNPGPQLRLLHERILRTDPTLDLPAAPVSTSQPRLPERPAPTQPHAPRPPLRDQPGLRQLPHDIANFTGRGAELAELDALAAEITPDRTTIISIDGAAGTGKTTLAVHWAHRQADRYPDLQIYLNLRGYGPGEPVSPAAATETLLRGLGVESERIPSGAEERSALLRSTLAGWPVLMLLDNARDADQVRPLLPGTGSLVIVTSRNQLRGLSIRDGASRVTLRRLPADQAVDLLAEAVGPHRVAAEPAAAARLVELCDNLPLALAIVAERTHRTTTLAGVVAALEDEKARLDNLGTGERDTDLRAAMSWSYQALSDEAASAMFRKLGLHPANDIGAETAAALADMPVTQAKAALDQLVAAHLVEQRRPDRYELHDLIRLYAIELASSHEPITEQDEATRRVLDWYLHAAAAGDLQLQSHRRQDFIDPYQPKRPVPGFNGPNDAMRWFEQEYDSLRSMMRWAADHGQGAYAWRIALTMASFMDRAIPRHDWTEVNELALKAAEVSGEPIGEAYMHNLFGSLLSIYGDYEIAESHFVRSLALFTDQGHTRGQQMSMANLSLMYAVTGHHEKSVELATKALDLCEQLGYRRGTALTLDNLGVALTVAGEPKLAIERHEQAHAIFVELGDLSSEASNQVDLARAYAALGDIPRATRAFRGAVNSYRALRNRQGEAVVLTDWGKLLSPDHPGIARGMFSAALATMRHFDKSRSQEIQDALASLPSAPGE